MSKIKVTDIDATGRTNSKYLKGDGTWDTPPGGGGGIPDAPVDGNYYARKDANWVSFDPTGGGGGGGTPEVRATGSALYFNNNTITVPWPTGTLEGDTVYIFTSHGWSASNPSGWEVLRNDAGTFINGAVWRKVMTSADISTGSVVINYAGSYYGVAQAITLKGTPTTILRSIVSNRVGFGSSSVTIASGDTAPNDLLLAFFGNRADSTNSLPSGWITLSSNKDNEASSVFGSLVSTSTSYSDIATASSAGSGYYTVVMSLYTPGGGGGGGGGGALIEISSQVLSTAQSEIVLDDFPTDFEDLIIVLTGASDKAASFDDLRMQVNGDTGTNYDNQGTESNGASVSGVASAGSNWFNIGWMPAATAPANSSGNCEIVLPSYARSTLEKTVLSRTSLKLSNSFGGSYVRNAGGWWRSASPISSIRLFCLSSNIAAGTVVTLYGRGGEAGSGGGGGSAFQLIGKVSLTTAGATVSFTSIPDTFTDLKITGTARGTAAADFLALRLRMNGDTGSNYDSSRVNRFGTNELVSGAYMEIGGLVIGDNGSFGVAGSFTLELPQYKNSFFNKQVIARSFGSTASAPIADYGGGSWKSVAPIDQIDLFLSSGNFAAGTEVCLWGLKA